MKLNEIVVCVQDCQSHTLHLKPGDQCKITDIGSRQIQVSAIDDKEYGQYAAIIMPKERFYECFLSTNELRKQKLKKLNNET